MVKYDEYTFVISQMVWVILSETMMRTKKNMLLKAIYYGRDLKHQMVSSYNDMPVSPSSS